MRPIILKNVTILDGTANMVEKPNQDILIKDGKIVKIGTNISERGKVIDLSGKYILPGLINLHIHLPSSGKIGKKKKKVADMKRLVRYIVTDPAGRAVGLQICYNNALMQLRSGTTTVRAVGGLSNFDSTLGKRLTYRKGPRIVAADYAIGPIGGHMVGTVAKGFKNVDNAVAQVVKNKENGADLIKLMITGGVLDCKVKGHPGDLKMAPEMVKACCDKAHELGLKVAAHVEGEEGMKVAIDNGVDSIEHGSDVSEAELKKLKARDGVLVCTLSPALPLAKLDYKKMGYSEDDSYNTTILLENIIKGTEKALQVGVTVGLGTDTGCPYITHYDMWRELVYFKKYIKGVDEKFAIHTATEVNAKIIGLDKEIGTIEEGKNAELMIVDNNPLKDLTALRDPYLVIYNGKLIKKKNKKFEDIDKDLDNLL